MIAKIIAYKRDRVYRTGEELGKFRQKDFNILTKFWERDSRCSQTDLLKPIKVN